MSIQLYSGLPTENPSSVFTPDDSLFSSDATAKDTDALNKPLWTPMRVDGERLCEFIVARLEKDQGVDAEDMKVKRELSL